VHLAHRDGELGFPRAVEVAEAAVAVTVRVRLDVLVPEQLERDVLALELTMDVRPVRLRPAAIAFLVPAGRNRASSRPSSVIASGKGQTKPAAVKRASVSRTVEGAIPIRRATSRTGTSAPSLNRNSSRTRRMATLSAGITASLPKGGDVKRQQRTRDPAHQTGGIIPERWAAIDRNGGRLQFGMTGDIISELGGGFARNYHGIEKHSGFE